MRSFNLRRRNLATTAAIAVSALSLLAVTPLVRPVFAEDRSVAQAVMPAGAIHDMPHGHGQSSGGMSGHSAAAHGGQVPVSAGQDAFGAIQEIVRMLEADPKTDRSHVNIDALREHLIDMNEVTLHARPQAEPVDGGLRIRVTGSGRTLDAIRRMVPAHAREMNGRDGWSVTTSPTADGVTLTATARDAAQSAKIRALGFMGIMVRGAHHQAHHLAMARGTFAH